ncbi:hypothetical protein ACOSQ2_026732 [Xanthoceras sorbifolium]
MLSNFKSTLKNLNMNDKLWKAARVGNVVGFHEAMESIKKNSVEAYVWLKPVDKWARHCFDPRIKSNHVTNNMSEYFNSWINDERDKPILTLLEHLRRKIMARLCEKVVRWKKCELPYRRAIAVFTYKREFAHDHVHWYYSKEVMMISYSGFINPIPNESRWHEYANVSAEPPEKRTKAGRPKKSRRRGWDEPSAPKKNFANRCRSCKALKYNSRTCPSKNTQGCTSKEKSVASKNKSAYHVGSSRTIADNCSQIGFNSQPQYTSPNHEVYYFY